MQQVEFHLLILLTERLGVGFPIRIEEFLAALLPRCFEFGCCDVPVRPAFPGNDTQILPEIFQSGSAEEPVAVIDSVHDKAGLKDDHVGDHRIVQGVGVLGDVEILLHDPPRVGKERSVGADSTAIFIGFS